MMRTLELASRGPQAIESRKKMIHSLQRRKKIIKKINSVIGNKKK